jgi:hypothetical protein
MADPAPASDPNDPSNPEYYRRMYPPAQTHPSTQTAPAAGDDTSVPWGKEAGLIGNQLGIGGLGLVAGPAALAMRLGHAVAPSYVPAVPDIMYPGGPHGYGNELTYGPLAPTNAPERVLAGASRSAGTAAPFGPRAMLIAGIGGGLGQTATEMGYPRVGEGIDFVSSLLGGYRGMTTGGWRGPSRAPAAAPVVAPTAPAAGGTGAIDMSGVFGEEGSNVVPFPRGGAQPAPVPSPVPTPAAGGAVPAAVRAGGEDSQMQRLIQLEEQANRIASAHLAQSTYAPLTRWMGPAQAFVNRYLARGALGGGGAAAPPSVATSTAQRVLGLASGIGTGLITGQDQGLQGLQ